MSDVVIKVENLSKQYRLGEVGTGTLSHDMNRWWHRVRGKPDPYLKIGETNDRATKGNSELVWALKDINFEVKQGEVLGIIGKNGAGKSTLLKILSKVTGPTTGRIRAKGRVASLLEVGTGFHPELTGRENIYLNGTILGMTKKEVDKKLDEIIDFAGVARYVDTPVKRYSSGMMVRLGFAVAAHLEPEVLIVDEVLAVGDAEFQQKSIGKMNQVSKDGRTILFVSHNMVAVNSLCTSSIYLKAGQIEKVGNTKEIISYYLNDNDSKTCEDLIINAENQKRTAGTQKAIKKIWIENNKGQIVKNVMMGEEIKICFSFELKSKLNNPYFGIGINNSYNERIVSLNTLMLGERFGEVKSGLVSFHLNDLRLTSNRFFLCPSIVDINMQYVDFIEGAGSFTVDSNDIYGTGKIPDKSQGINFSLGKIYLKNN